MDYTPIFSPFSYTCSLVHQDTFLSVSEIYVRAGKFTNNRFVGTFAVASMMVGTTRLQYVPDEAGTNGTKTGYDFGTLVTPMMFTRFAFYRKVFLCVLQKASFCFKQKICLVRLRWASAFVR